MTAKAARAMITTPPTTPPAIAATLDVPLWLCAGGLVPLAESGTDAFWITK